MTTAPRVTPDDLENEIASEHYFIPRLAGHQGIISLAGPAVLPGGIPPEGFRPLDNLTICILILRNGITITGESACVSAANFDADTGRRIARESAVRKLWPLLGFRLADKLYHDSEWTQFQERHR